MTAEARALIAEALIAEARAARCQWYPDQYLRLAHALEQALDRDATSETALRQRLGELAHLRGVRDQLQADCTRHETEARAARTALAQTTSFPLDDGHRSRYWIDLCNEAGEDTGRLAFIFNEGGTFAEVRGRGAGRLYAEGLRHLAAMIGTVAGALVAPPAELKPLEAPTTRFSGSREPHEHNAAGVCEDWCSACLENLARSLTPDGLVPEAPQSAEEGA